MCCLLLPHHDWFSHIVSDFPQREVQFNYYSTRGQHTCCRYASYNATDLRSSVFCLISKQLLYIFSCLYFPAPIANLASRVIIFIAPRCLRSEHETHPITPKREDFLFLSCLCVDWWELSWNYQHLATCTHATYTHSDKQHAALVKEK